VVDRWVTDPRVRRDALIGLGMLLLALTASVGFLAAAGTVTIGAVSIGTAGTVGIGAAAVAAKLGTGSVIRWRRRKRGR
jgi:hypothetical protein